MSNFFDDKKVYDLGHDEVLLPVHAPMPVERTALRKQFEEYCTFGPEKHLL